MANDLQYKIGIDGTAAAATLRGLSGLLVGLGTGAALAGLVRRGLDFNRTMNDSEAAIAKVISQFGGLNDEAAKGEAAKAMQQLIELEPKAAGSLKDLVQGFMGTLAASQAAGISVKDNIDLVGRFANAMANADIPTEQLGQEMRSIVTANIGADSSLARILGITNDMVKQAMEAGNVYGLLTEKIGKLGTAGDTAGVAFSSLETAIDQAAGALTEGLFEEALSGAKSLTSAIVENEATWRNLGAAIGYAAQKFVQVLGFINEVSNVVTDNILALTLLTDANYTVSEAAQIMAELTQARQRDTEAAKEQARAAHDAATQTAPSSLPSASSSPLAATRPAGGDDPFADAMAKQQQLDAIRQAAAEEAMSTEQRLADLRQRMLQIAQEESALKGDPFAVPDAAKLLDLDIRRAETAREIAALERQQAADAASRAESARRSQDRLDAARNSVMGELAVLEARAAGNEKLAAALERQIRLQADAARIAKETGASEAEALRLAEDKLRLEERIAANAKGPETDATGRRKIRGFSSGLDPEDRSNGLSGRPSGPLAKGGPLTAGGGIDAFKRSQLGPGAFDRLQKDPGIMSRMLATTSPSSAGGSSKPARDPSTSKLDSILTELTRIRTT